MFAHGTIDARPERVRRLQPNARIGVSYKYRNLVRTVEDMSNDEANTYFIGNPGSEPDQGVIEQYEKGHKKK